MTRGNIISALGGLLFSLIVSGVVYYKLILDTLDFLGTQSIIDPEGRHGKMFYTALTVFTTTCLVIVGLLQLKRKYAAIGVGIPLLGTLWVLLTVGPVFLDKSNYYDQFNKGKWNQSSGKPLKMARQLATSNELVGRPVDEVTGMLGEGLYSESKEYLIYETDHGYCSLALGIKDDTVWNARLWVED